MKRWPAAVFAAVLSLSSGGAIAPLAAQEPPASQTLLPGKGAELTMARCAICHDITHVTRTRLSRAEWEDNIKVMIARGMPIEAHEIPVVIDYLSTYYNRDKPPPAADASAPAPAAGPLPITQVLSERGCVACHALDTKLVGPSFREIASRYKGDAGAASTLAGKIREGGAGTWGTIPMPPHPQIDDPELKRVVTWVLEQ